MTEVGFGDIQSATEERGYYYLGQLLGFGQHDIVDLAAFSVRLWLFNARNNMEGRLDSIIGLLIFFAPIIVSFVLVAFTPIGQLRQPKKILAIGIASGAVAAFLSALAMTKGTMGIRGFLTIVGISTVGAPLLSLLFSSATVTEQTRDEIVRKSDDQSWR